MDGSDGDDNEDDGDRDIDFEGSKDALKGFENLRMDVRNTTSQRKPFKKGSTSNGMSTAFPTLPSGVITEGIANSITLEKGGVVDEKYVDPDFERYNEDKKRVESALAAQALLMSQDLDGVVLDTPFGGEEGVPMMNEETGYVRVDGKGNGNVGGDFQFSASSVVNVFHDDSSTTHKPSETRFFYNSGSNDVTGEDSAIIEMVGGSRRDDSDGESCMMASNVVGGDYGSGMGHTLTIGGSGGMSGNNGVGGGSGSDFSCIEGNSMAAGGGGGGGSIYAEGINMGGGRAGVGVFTNQNYMNKRYNRDVEIINFSTIGDDSIIDNEQLMNRIAEDTDLLVKTITNVDNDDFDSSANLNTNESKISGRIGEKIALNYLPNYFPVGSIFEWKNEYDEQGHPYDILVSYVDENGLFVTKYCEVKTRLKPTIEDNNGDIDGDDVAVESTLNATIESSKGTRHRNINQWFISPKEIAFAQEQKKLYCRYFYCRYAPVKMIAASES